MRAMVLERPGSSLVARELPEPEPGPGQLRVRVEACGVCRTDLHVLDGELPDPKLPLVLGHQIVGVVDACGDGVELEPGERVGVPWLGWTCGECRFCRSGRENLCERALFTGYNLDGGYAEAAVADARYCFRIPEGYDAVQAAPLLCAGLIGYRSLRLAGDARAARPLRLRRLRARRRAGREARGPARLRLHPRRRHARPGVRALARRRVGGRLGRAAARAARRRDRLRARGRARPGGPSCARPRRRRSSARGST